MPDYALFATVRILLELVSGRDIGPAEAVDVLQQWQTYERSRGVLERLFPNRIVLVIDGEIYVGDTLDEVVKRAHAHNPGRSHYAVQQGRH
jgi:hypothetical protein